MGPHDGLMSALIAMQRQLEEYVNEFEPVFGTRCLEHMGKVMLLANGFPEDASPEETASQPVKKD